MRSALKKFLLVVTIVEAILGVIYFKAIYAEANTRAHQIANRISPVPVRQTEFRVPRPVYIGRCLPRSQYQFKEDADYYGCGAGPRR